MPDWQGLAGIAGNVHNVLFHRYNGLVREENSNYVGGLSYQIIVTQLQ